jgi:hypothetical protein
MKSIDSCNSSTLKPPLKEAVKVLHPLTHHVEVRYRNRFSMLLLEHGEQHLQDWAVVASSSVVNESTAAAISVSKTKKTEWNKSAKQGRKKAHSHSHGNENNGYGSTIMGKLEGRLHLCSRSIVFEPLETSRGIIRCPFNRMETSPREISSTPSSVTSNCVKRPTMQRETSTSNALFGSFEAIASLSIEFFASRHLIMKENNVIGPFESIEIPTKFGFTFLHSCPEMFVELCQVCV